MKRRHYTDNKISIKAGTLGGVLDSCSENAKLNFFIMNNHLCPQYKDYFTNDKMVQIYKFLTHQSYKLSYNDLVYCARLNPETVCCVDSDHLTEELLDLFVSQPVSTDMDSELTRSKFIVKNYSFIRQYPDCLVKMLVYDYGQAWHCYVKDDKTKFTKDQQRSVLGMFDVYMNDGSRSSIHNIDLDVQVEYWIRYIEDQTKKLDSYDLTDDSIAELRFNLLSKLSNAFIGEQHKIFKMTKSLCDDCLLKNHAMAVYSGDWEMFLSHVCSEGALTVDQVRKFYNVDQSTGLLWLV